MRPGCSRATPSREPRPGGAPHAVVPRGASRRASTARRSPRSSVIETAGGARRALRHRPRHPPGRHHHRHQGPGGLRGAGRGDAAHRAPRAGEAGADTRASSASRTRWRRPTATWCTRASCSIRCAATSRRCCCPRSSRVTGEVHLLLRPGSLFIEGVESPYSLMAASRGVYGEAAGEWTASRCARLLQASSPCPACSTRAPASAPPPGRAEMVGMQQRGRRQARLGHPGLRPRPRGAASQPTSPPRKAWWWWSRC